MSNSQPIKRIPDGLVIAILPLLPTKSLCRFRCVSKLWTTFIARVSSQRTTLLPMSGFFFYQFTNSLLGFYAPTNPHHYIRHFKSRMANFPFYSKSILIHTCNGLFLFEDMHKHHHHKKAIYYVCNPATTEFLALPEAPRKNNPPFCYLAFDPHNSPHYKVVRFTFNEQLALIIVEMYSSLTGTWAMFIRTASFGKWNPDMVFHKGLLHMITLKHDLLVRFDTNKGSFDALVLPGNQSSIQRGCVGVSRGHLYLALNDGYPTSQFQVYMLNEECTYWLLTHTVMLREEIASLFYGVVAFQPESEVIYLSICGNILSCNPITGELKEIWSIDGKVVHKVFPVIYCLEPLNPSGAKVIHPFTLDNK